MSPAENSVAGKGYLVRRHAEAPTVACPCGMSTRILTRGDGALANFHITRITDSVKHYHKQSTEIYFILEGNGTLELGDDLVEVEPGTLVVIEPLTAHRLVSTAGVRTVVLGIPALRDDDEYFVNA
jgi:mannose-6-phosphate isomerase-like protein (cupin superfamily)